MKILHVITSMIKTAGTSIFVRGLAHEQVERGHNVAIVHLGIWLKDIYELDSRIEFVGEPDFWSAVDGCFYDIVHIHGLWEPMLHRFAVYARKHGIKIVWSTHGALTKWALRNHWWKKLPVWLLYQKRDLRLAAAIHVTAQSEVEDVRRIGFTNKVIVAPLGVAICDNHKRMGGGHVMLFVGRIHPIKNLPTLMRAFGSVMQSGESAANQWRLRVVGPDQEGHAAELKGLVKDLGIEDSVEFVKPKYGDELKQEYINADCFVLPSHSENFGSVVIEALSAGVPVITTKGTPWQELEEHDCGRWVDISEPAIEKAIVEMISKTDEERKAMGQRGIQLVKSKYSWGAVCDKVIKGYEDVLND